MQVWLCELVVFAVVGINDGEESADLGVGFCSVREVSEGMMGRGGQGAAREDMRELEEGEAVECGVDAGVVVHVNYGGKGVL